MRINLISIFLLSIISNLTFAEKMFNTYEFIVDVTKNEAFESPVYVMKNVPITISVSNDNSYCAVKVDGMMASDVECRGVVNGNAVFISGKSNENLLENVLGFRPEGLEGEFSSFYPEDMKTKSETPEKRLSRESVQFHTELSSESYHFYFYSVE